MTRPPDATPLPATVEAISDEIEKISSLILGAARLLNEHKRVDLGTMEGRISALCAAIAELPEGEATVLQTPLEIMLDQLNTLEKALSEEHESLSSLLEGETRAKEMAAARSYGAGSPAPSSAPSPSDDDGDDTET